MLRLHRNCAAGWTLRGRTWTLSTHPSTRWGWLYRGPASFERGRVLWLGPVRWHVGLV